MNMKTLQPPLNSKPWSQVFHIEPDGLICNALPWQGEYEEMNRETDWNLENDFSDKS